ncbi:sulfite exporter TauE/SafE family protein [Parasulfuritortus cantonensis]|uniref:Sulfite exporter TauE/SafE family protein n=1 Tax=Parasulfuritortus cantonensis TaxID=2528202 RepID=A0A4R1BGM0_9PROT|nr:sulfite exporter TauE/SafE family protein [Parasulfuritortus cantonensis]TCJ16307.1 sulfite exporter TauE/SafE family protein [Parasulfuritortus cantonensis]
MPEISLITAFLAGLLGGAHCVGMCGGIVAAMSLQGGRRQPLPFHLGYNLGRLASYTLAGALAGLAGSAAFLSDRLLPVQTGLFVVAQVVLILMGLYLAGLNRAVLWLEHAGGGLWRRLQPVFGRLLPIRDFPGAVAAGLVWGWLPCGLVYSVLVTALASGGPVSGALLMLAFGFGTLPNLLAMGWAAERLRALAANRAVKLAAGLIVAGFGVWGLLGLVR